MIVPGLVVLLLSSAARAPAAPPPKAQRIVALAPSAAEILFALGAADRVVAVPEFAGDLPEAAGKPRIGGFSPDLEKVVSLRPDVAVASRDGTDRAAAERLASLGIRVLATRGSSLEGVLMDIMAVGDAIGEGPRARSLVLELRRREAAAEARARERVAPRHLSAAAVIWPDPPVLAGPRSFVGDLLVRAGLTNVVPDSSGEWPRLSHEALAALAPSVLVRPETAENREAFRLAFGPKSPWALVPAVRAGRVVDIPGALLERPGPRLFDALEVLVERLEALKP